MKLFKYPRTYHLPFSPGRGNDDKVLKSLDAFTNKNIVVTEKLDGENFSLYRDACHARSVSSCNHPSRTWIKNFHGALKHRIPRAVRICGENVYAKHSILYTNLASYFYGFSVWGGQLMWGWDDTRVLLRQLDIPVVPVIYRGVFSKSMLLELATQFEADTSKEGFVVRTTKPTMLNHFGSNVAKWVRKDHVQTEDHWMHSKITKNRLAA